MVEGRNGAMIQPLLLGDQAERGDMHLALLVEGGDDDSRIIGMSGSKLLHEASRFFLAISVWPASFSLVWSSAGASAATPQSSGSSWA